LSAQEIGIPAYSALTYAANAEGTQVAYSMIAGKVANYRKSKDAEALRFNDDDRERQKKAGAKK